MAKMKPAGSYIYDFAPVTVVQEELTEAEVRALVKEKLGIESLEFMVGDQWIMNKLFVDLEGPDAEGRMLALYNHDGVYSMCRYKPRPRP